jgi:hypothetical protein
LGGAVSEIEAPWARALHLSEKLGEVDHQLRSLAGLWLVRDQGALGLARQFSALASTPADGLFGKFMVAVSSRWVGDLNTARQYLEHVIVHSVAHESGRQIIRYQVNLQPVAKALLAPILWRQGFPRQAIDIANGAVEEARATDHAISLCRSLARAGCPIALWVGDLELTEVYIDLLLYHSRRHGLALWHSFGKAYRGVLLIRRGNLRSGLPLLRGGFDEFGAAIAGYRVLMFLGELALGLRSAGQLSEALATVEGAIDRCERSGELWIMAELLRLNGELLVARRSWSSGRRRGSLPAGVRLGASAGRSFLGAARRH